MGSTKSKNTANPFAELNIHQFPADRKQRDTYRREEAAKHSGSSAGSVPSGEEDSDADLFFQAVGAVRSLTGESSARRASSAPDGATDGQPAPVTATAREEWKLPSPPPEKRGLGEHSSEVSKSDILAQKLAHYQALQVKAGHTEKQRREAPASAKKMQLAIPDTASPPDQEVEDDTFHRAMADVTPLAGKGRTVAPRPGPRPGPAIEPSNPLRELVDGKVEFSLSGTDEFVEGHVVGLDLLTVGKLQARQYSPEAHIDLHGLNSEQAFQHLIHFFRSAYHKGVRTALVVTGRGLNSPNGIPVLRFKVQQWLTQEPFRRVILAFCTARREDGGPGALYVLLRKYRKNSGKVRWDAMPADPDLFL